MKHLKAAKEVGQVERADWRTKLIKLLFALLEKRKELRLKLAYDSTYLASQLLASNLIKER